VIERATLLTPERMTEIERLARRSRSGVVGALGGQHRSPRRGSSLDFADHRLYAPGDDVRHIDQHALARFDQLVVRQFEAEERTTVRLVLDTSASMRPGDKYRHAAEIAAALGFVALCSGDHLVVHSAETVRFQSRSSLPSFLDHLCSREVRGAHGLDALISDVVTDRGSPGVTIVLSDLLDPDWHAAFRRLPHPRRATAIVHVLHPDELDPTVRGDVELVDVESSERRVLSVDARAAKDYRARVDGWLAEVSAAALHLRFGHHLSLVGSDVVSMVVAALDRSLGARSGSMR
jgi:uncharacterized protein (DUF58 family)